MILLYPWMLAALAVLPLLWWLLRLTPPPSRLVRFPAARLLIGLPSRETTPARTPVWLTLLRMAAAALLILGLAGPTIGKPEALPGSGPVVVAMDDGWAAAPDWPARIRAADDWLERAEAAGRGAVLLTTAPDETGAAPRPTAVLPAGAARDRVASLRPKPWASDRSAAVEVLGRTSVHGAVLYVSDGVASDADAAFGAALDAVGPVTLVSADATTLGVLLAPRLEADTMTVRAAVMPGVSRVLTASAIGPGGAVARVSLPVDTDAATAEAALTVPVDVRNTLVRLSLDGAPTAGGTWLLDGTSRRRTVGLLTEEGSDTPFTGSLFYLRRALSPYAELRDGTAEALLRRPLSVLVAADLPLTGATAEAVDSWVRQGGLLLRFAGPRLAAASAGDTLLPVPLLDSARQTGGALSWSRPAHLAAFPPGPFAGLPVPPEVTVSTQVLAEPGAALTGHVWAALTDGTPLVTERARGRGRIVLFHVSPDADWSTLPLSGVFVDMLRRVVAASSGAVTNGDAKLAPAQMLDGFGVLGRPTPAAAAITGEAIIEAGVSPTHPPGLYGPENDRRALNVGTASPALAPMAPIPRERALPLGAVASAVPLGPWLIGAATLLLALDLLAALALRGLLRPASAMAATLLAGLLAAWPARAGTADIEAALTPRLAYVRTGDPDVDDVSKAGLDGLAAYVNRKTSATLAPADAVTPGQDDLSFYPLLYWPVSADSPPQSAAAIAALNGFTAHGGIILIDTRDGITTDATLGPALAGLVVPTLTTLTARHVLAHSFYLLTDFPGRFDGTPIWVERQGTRDNDDVSPIIVGSNDWAAAWASDAGGRAPYAMEPGGARQRLLAYRFGINLVMYALTGNYKGDQVHIPALLERLGQ